MIPWVSGKCILRAFTSSRFLPLSNVAVDRLRWMNWSCCTAIALLLRARRWRRRLAAGLDAFHLGRQVRDLRFDRLELLDAAHVPAPVGVREPASLLGAEPPGFVIAHRGRAVLALRNLFRAGPASVLAWR